MESLHQLLLERHSIRRYTDEKIDGEHVKTILEAALLAPTSKNSRSWQFVVVEDPEMLIRLSTCKPSYATSIREAAFAVVVTADPALSEAFVEDASIAAELMQLQAHDLGIGSCWVQVRGRYAEDGESSEYHVQTALGIPADMQVLCIMTFGYPAELRKPADPSKLKWEKVHIGMWNAAQADE